MKRKISKLSLFLAAVMIMCAALVGCDLRSNTEKLPAPTVVIWLDGTAVWTAIDDVLYYIYVIDDGAEALTTESSVKLESGQSIKVKAVSSRQGVGDSDFSAVQTYTEAQVDPSHTEHTDINGDGICDYCRESVIVELSFYAVNDLHGKFMDTSSQPGLDEFTTYLKNLYADPTREEILLSSGDMWQGTVESSSNHGQLMTEWMNDVGFVSMTLGNHEYDWGPAALTTNSQLAEFPLLGINVTYNGKMPDYCQASTIVERDGVKIGIIGAIGDCLSSISGEFQSGLKFATGSSLTTLVKNEAIRLRTQEECDFIVYSLHDGGDQFSSSRVNSVKNSDMEWYDTSLSDGYVDLVFEGHSHYRYIAQDEYGVYHLQGGGENKAVSCVKVDFNKQTGDFTVTPSHVMAATYGSSSIKDDPIVEEIFTKYFPEENPYETILGVNAQYRTDDEIGDQVAELYYEKGVETWGSEYTIVAAGGMLKTRNPYDLKAGSITYADLYSLLPFDNAIVLGRIRGSDLKRKFLGSTNSSYHVFTAPGISSSAINDSQNYYIVVDTYTAYYSWNNIQEVARLDNTTYARDILAEFISELGWA